MFTTDWKIHCQINFMRFNFTKEWLMKTLAFVFCALLFYSFGVIINFFHIRSDSATKLDEPETLERWEGADLPLKCLQTAELVRKILEKTLSLWCSVQVNHRQTSPRIAWNILSLPHKLISLLQFQLDSTIWLYLTFPGKKMALSLSAFEREFTW